MTKQESLAQMIDGIGWSIGVLSEARNQPGLTPDQRNQLTAQIQDLRVERDALSLASLDQALARLTTRSGELDQIATAIHHSSNQLADIAKHIATAAKVLGIAASIAAKAASGIG